ncbi:hypothetical protein NQ314_019003 [Rhamnusium bicolor]|uniref:RNA helicase aquarius N-terminal domain-containing protein n=1 Tax=Rhamnusium bicolor TaxID=1586634 RepID=A0AAV8WPN6_9CUCU|nr:hypothetical protein NQ314_019003 [Rhamnusium bicolor]
MTGTSGQNTVITPTVEQIISDRITQLAEKYWAPHSKEKHLEYDPNIIEDIYMQDIRGSNFSIRRIMVLEFSQYLENYLWPNYKPGASYAHMLSIVIMVNEKFRERVQVWQLYAVDQVKRLVSLSMWISLQPARRESEFKKYPKWKKYWRAIQRKDKPEQMEKLLWERTFLRQLMLKFMDILDTITEDELITDLEALLPTRRFFNTVLDDCHLVVRCQLSALIRRPEGHLFSQ